MEIRAIQESEIPEMIDLQCQVFQPDRRERYTQYISGDSSYRLDQTRVVIEDGRIVATLRVWDREMRIGSTAVKMGGIGGVGTLPEYRQKGFATALMEDTVEYLKSSGYHVGLLFSEIPNSFYRRLDWSSVPTTGFHIRANDIFPSPKSTSWRLEHFDEVRDLEQVIELYQSYNAGQSGSIVRNRALWDSAPARLRGVLPTIVARRGDALGGYLSYRLTEEEAQILEVAHVRDDTGPVEVLAHHLLGRCIQSNYREIYGEFPHRQPFVELLRNWTSGDFAVTGTDSMMLYAVNFDGLLKQLKNDWQARVGQSSLRLKPCSFSVESLMLEQRVVSLKGGGRIDIRKTGKHDWKDDSLTDFPGLPFEIFLRAAIGEASWNVLEPMLRDRLWKIRPEHSALLNVLFPAQDPVLWAPDHF